ncbi:hypothetical protein ABRZ03_05035 [Castellaniella ginsengisoli]|uniref:Uncharacterized protein n=1 Tax=Castellaniella ginsengisoli TaxID=546114 RepID=A0AB39ECT2_9BURK
MFVRDKAQANELTEGSVSHWLLFKEVKQNWLGFSKQGNSGTGLGKNFAQVLARNFQQIFRDFGKEQLTKGSHLEKLGLLSGGVGRDHLSDFTTNLIKGYLLKYTEEFAKKYLKEAQTRRIHVERVDFNYETQRWQSGHFMLPWHASDYVILTPCEILTRDDAWINQGESHRVFRRLRFLREWSHEQEQQVFPRSS